MSLMPSMLFTLAAIAAALWRFPLLRRLVGDGLRDGAARIRARFGPMSPAALTAATMWAARQQAVITATGSVMPNHIRVGVHPSDLDSWGPLAKDQPDELAAQLTGYVAASADVRMLGRLDVDVHADPGAKPHRPRFAMQLVPGEAEQSSERSVRIPISTVTADLHAASAPRATSYSPPPKDGGDSSLSEAGKPTEPLLVVEVLVDDQVVQTFELGRGVHRVGRGRACALRIDHGTVSDVHAELNVGRFERTIRDLGSTNGTHVRWARLNGTPARVGDNDVILLSSAVSLRVLRGGSPQSEDPAG